MKKLYEFTAFKEEEITKIEESVNEAGDKVKVEKKVKEKVPYRFFLKRPNRSVVDSSEMFYAICVADGVRAGMLTAAQLYKRFANDGGILSDPDKERWDKLSKDVINLNQKFQQIMMKTDKTDQDEEEAKDIISNLVRAREDLQKFELQQSALFDQTAETRARNQTILWFVLHLSYQIDKDGKETPFFGEGDFKEKLNKYDEMEESADPFLSAVIKRIFFLVSFWYMGRAVDSDDFKQVDEFAEKDEG